MKNKDYSVAFGNTKASTNLALKFDSLSKNHQRKLIRLWNDYTRGLKDIEQAKYCGLEFLQMWLVKHKEFIKNSSFDEDIKEKITSIIYAKHRSVLRHLLDTKNLVNKK